MHVYTGLNSRNVENRAHNEVDVSAQNGAALVLVWVFMLSIEADGLFIPLVLRLDPKLRRNFDIVEQVFWRQHIGGR